MQWGDNVRVVPGTITHNDSGFPSTKFRVPGTYSAENSTSSRRCTVPAFAGKYPSSIDHGKGQTLAALEYPKLSVYKMTYKLSPRL